MNIKKKKKVCINDVSASFCVKKVFPLFVINLYTFYSYLDLNLVLYLFIYLFIYLCIYLFVTFCFRMITFKLSPSSDKFDSIFCISVLCLLLTQRFRWLQVQVVFADFRFF